MLVHCYLSLYIIINLETIFFASAVCVHENVELFMRVREATCAPNVL